MNDYDERWALVIDNGSLACKAGIAGNDEPTTTFHNGALLNGNIIDSSIGDQSQAFRELTNLKYPIQYGIVTDWDGMEKIWRHVLSDPLNVANENPVLLTETALNPHSNREKMFELMFETFGVPACYVSTQGILALYSSGRTTGVVLDMGEGVTNAFPIKEGYSIHQSIARFNVAGGDLTSYLSRLLKEREIYIDREQVRIMKEKLCYSCLDFKGAMESSFSTQENYQLPDGRCITIDKERIQVGEALFDPSLLGMKSEGIHEFLYDCIMKCSYDSRKEMFGNIVFTGGNSMLPGFVERMQTHFKDLLPTGTRTHMVAPPERKISVWIGGSILGSLTSMTAKWILKEEYEEFGPIIARRCIL